MGQRSATIDVGPTLRASAPYGAKLDPHVTQCCLGRGQYIPTKWHLDPSSRLVTRDMGRKWGVCPLLGGAGSPSNAMSHGPRPTSLPSGILIHPTIWLQQIWSLCPFGGGELDSRLTQCGQGRGLPAYLSNCLATIHQRYRQDRTYRHTDRQRDRTDRQRSDSIGRTVLQMVAQSEIKYNVSN